MDDGRHAGLFSTTSDVLGAIVEAVVGGGEAELGSDDDVVVGGLHCAAGDLLVLAPALKFGGVKEPDAEGRSPS